MPVSAARILEFLGLVASGVLKSWLFSMYCPSSYRTLYINTVAISELKTSWMKIFLGPVSQPPPKVLTRTLCSIVNHVQQRSFPPPPPQPQPQPPSLFFKNLLLCLWTITASWFLIHCLLFSSIIIAFLIIHLFRTLEDLSFSRIFPQLSYLPAFSLGIFIFCVSFKESRLLISFPSFWNIWQMYYVTDLSDCFIFPIFHILAMVFKLFS